jgi:hypothetical protein
MKLTTTAKYTAIVAVAGIAAYASYSHMRDLAIEHGQSGTVAALLPISVDGMLIVATVAMKEDRANGLKVRLWAWVAFVLGVLASVVANVLAADDDLTSRVISAWPAVALLLVIEVLATGKKPVELPAEVPAVKPVKVPTEGPAPRPARKPAAKAVAKAAKTTPRRPAEVTRKLAAEALADPEATRTAVAEQLDITPRRLRQVLNENSGEQQTVNGTPVLETQPA